MSSLSSLLVDLINFRGFWVNKGLRIVALGDLSRYTERGEWDFRKENTKEYTHCFHIYPAMMIPQIARELINRYGVPGGLLFDPYCGAGTSIVEAKLAGMNAIGTDLNALARLIVHSKIHDYDLHELTRVIEIFGAGLESYLDSESDTDPEDIGVLDIETIERMSQWFPRRSLTEISLIINRIGDCSDGIYSDFLAVAFSECLRLVSFQRNNEFKLYRISPTQRGSHYVPLGSLLLDRIMRNLAGYIQLRDCLTEETETEVYSFNTVSLQSECCPIEVESVDLVVTSPPYGDSGTTVAYAQFSWLTNRLLGLDPRPAGRVDRSLMGGKRTEVSAFGFEPMDTAIANIKLEDDRRASEVMDFYTDYLASISNVATLVRTGGVVAYVIGNRTVKGIQLPTDQFTAWAFQKQGFEYISTHVREIPNKRMPSRNSPSNVAGQTGSTMVGEFIVLCRKL